MVDNTNFSHVHKLFLVLALVLGEMAVAFESYAVTTTMPVVARSLGDLDLFAYAFTVFVLAMVFAQVLAGRLCDHWGPVIPLAWGFIIFTVGVIAAGFAPSMIVFLICRLIQGFGAGWFSVSLMVLVAGAFTGNEVAKLMSLTAFAWMLPSFIGPALAAWITETFSWHWVFWALAPILLFAMCMGFVPLRIVQRQWVASSSQKGVSLIWAAVTALTLALFQLSADQHTVAGIAVAGVMLIALAVLLPKIMPIGFRWAKPGLSSLMTTRTFVAGSLYGVESFLPMLLVEVHSITLIEAGLVLSAGGVGWAVGAAVQASRHLRIRRDHIIIIGSAVNLASLIAIATLVLVFPQVSHYVIVVLWGIVSFGVGLAVLSTSLANITLSDPEELGRNTASLQLSDAFGSALCIGTGGVIFTSLHDTVAAHVTYGLLVSVQTFIALAGLVLALRITAVKNEVSGVS